MIAGDFCQQLVGGNSNSGGQLSLRLDTLFELTRDGKGILQSGVWIGGLAWLLLVLQLLSLIVAGIGKAISTPAHPLHLDAGFSTSGWLAVILTFVLARVFAEGALMREDLDGTV